MEAEEYREVVAKLGLSQEAAGDFLLIGKRTSQGYALGEYLVPNPTAILLRLLVAGKITIADVTVRNGSATKPVNRPVNRGGRK